MLIEIVKKDERVLKSTPYFFSLIEYETLKQVDIKITNK